MNFKNLQWTFEFGLDLWRYQNFLNRKNCEEKVYISYGNTDQHLREVYYRAVCYDQRFCSTSFTHDRRGTGRGEGVQDCGEYFIIFVRRVLEEKTALKIHFPWFTVRAISRKWSGSITNKSWSNEFSLFSPHPSLRPAVTRILHTLHRVVNALMRLLVWNKGHLIFIQVVPVI